MAELSESLSVSGSWDDLAPAEPIDLPEPENLPPDDVEEVPAGICRVCGDPIVREPGTRGRMPKTHKDCRSLRPVGGTTSSATVRNNKKEREAQQAVDGFKKAIMKGLMLVAVADPYDAFCVMASLPDFCANLKAVLVRHDKMRAEFLAIGEGGSILGLIISVIVMLLPILAHHGILKFKQDRIQALLTELPKTLYKLRLKMESGEATLTAMMSEQMEQFQAAKRQAENARTVA